MSNEKMPRLVLNKSGTPVSGCCLMTIERFVDYTDTHVFTVEKAETNEDGEIITASFQFLKTYDGEGTAGPTYRCSACSKEIDTGNIEFDEE